MQKSIWGLVALGLGLALFASLAGCGMNEGNARSGEEDREVRPGGVFRTGLVRVASEDPARARTVSERILADHLFDGLTAWDPRTLRPVPALAERWEASPDQRQWTFFMRAGLRAANGEAVTAADVKTSLQRVARQATESPSTDLLADIAGFAAFTSSPEPNADLAGIVVVSATEVRITLDEPSAEFARMLGNPTFGIVHQVGAAGGDPSTGPFAVGSREPDRLHLVRAPGSAALLDGIDVHFFPGVDAGFAAFERGEIDWALVPAERADEAGARYGRRLFEPALRSLFLAFDLADPKFADVRFRQAIARAIDRRAVVTALGVDSAQLLDGLLGNDVAGAEGGGCGSPCFYDPDSARELLAQVFPPPATPPLITLDVAAGAPMTEAAVRRIVEDLGRVGVGVNLRTTPAEQYGSVTVAADRELFQASWSAPYPSADAVLPPLFESNSRSNVAGFADADMDRRLRETKAIADPGERLRRFQAIERDLFAAVPLVPLASFPVDAVAVEAARGIATLPTGNFDATRVWLDRPVTTTTSPVTTPVPPPPA